MVAFNPCWQAIIIVSENMKRKKKRKKTRTPRWQKLNQSVGKLSTVNDDAHTSVTVMHNSNSCTIKLDMLELSDKNRQNKGEKIKLCKQKPKPSISKTKHPKPYHLFLPGPDQRLLTLTRGYWYWPEATDTDQSLLILTRGYWPWPEAIGTDQRLLTLSRCYWHWQEAFGPKQRLLALTRGYWPWSKATDTIKTLTRDYWPWPEDTDPD